MTYEVCRKALGKAIQGSLELHLQERKEHTAKVKIDGSRGERRMLSGWRRDLLGREARAVLLTAPWL